MSSSLQPQSAMRSVHPKRTPAHRSVSLLHTPRVQSSYQTSDSSTDSNRANRSPLKRKRDSPSSLQPLGRNSSGESSNAEKWFEKSNNDAYKNKHAAVDNDPPFFMRNNSSSESPPDQHLLNFYRGQPDALTDSLPNQTGLLHLGNDGGSAQEFRSVIDDLTVQNKKLRRRLKKYEKLHDSHLKDEKLFEVRIHGLPPAKKQELEETLRSFAAGLGQRGMSAAGGFPINGYEGLQPLLNTHKPTYSQTASSNAHPSDSAYASMSASGQGSLGLPGAKSRKKMSAQSATARQQNIHSYLHHIPEGLMPQQEPASMSQKAMKKMIVGRLEQIFAGKGAAVSGHQQSFQQEEVSQMAARAERSAIEARGQRAGTEGGREARIMEEETEDPLNPASLKRPTADPATNVQAEEELIAEIDFADKTAPEQRPTRPLDLDPHRAQVPDENIQYIRHLGFSPNIDSDRSPEDDHGWIYLNLLVNMAQLHTINVTVDYIRKAIIEFSDKFEVSADGRKVRWRRGVGGMTNTSSNDDSSSVGVNTPSGQSPRKRIKLNRGDSSFSRRSANSRGKSAQPKQNENKFVYTPLFFHREDSDDGSITSSSEGEEDDPPFPQVLGNNSSAMTSSGGLAGHPPRRNKKRDDGPIIFYNNARFCTDLSGDHNINGNYNAPTYRATPTIPLGEKQPRPSIAPEKRGPLDTARHLPEPRSLDGGSTPESQKLTFPPQSPLESRTEKELREARPIALEVSGIGGVCPADNFAICVSSRHARTDQSEAPAPPRHTAPKLYPAKIAAILKGSDPTRRTRSAVHKHMQVVTSDTQVLPPSELPPALGYMAFDSTQFFDEDDDDDDDAMSISPASHDRLRFPPSTAPQALDVPYASESSDSEASASGGDEESDEGSGDETAESDDGSVDMLASAREHDPEAILRKEREYDANMAERLAEEIPAGSSAATAGGGSGFNSPATGVGRGEYRQALREKRAVQGIAAAGKGSKGGIAEEEEEGQGKGCAVPGLGKEDTGSSMVVEGREGSVGTD